MHTHNMKLYIICKRHDTVHIQYSIIHANILVYNQTQPNITHTTLHHAHVCMHIQHNVEHVHIHTIRQCTRIYARLLKA